MIQKIQQIQLQNTFTAPELLILFAGLWLLLWSLLQASRTCHASKSSHFPLPMFHALFLQLLSSCRGAPTTFSPSVGSRPLPKNIKCSIPEPQCCTLESRACLSEEMGSKKWRRQGCRDGEVEGRQLRGTESRSGPLWCG